MYKLGDKVVYQGADKKAYKRVGVLKSIEVLKSIGEKDGKPQLTVEFDDGETFTAPVDDWSREFTNACTSTNSVVRNAMAANRRVARNGESEQRKIVEMNIDSLKKGPRQGSARPRRDQALDGQVRRQQDRQHRQG